MGWADVRGTAVFEYLPVCCRFPDCYCVRGDWLFAVANPAVRIRANCLVNGKLFGEWQTVW